MAEIHFHDLAGRPLVPVLAGLLEPVVAAGERAVVVAGSEERLQAVDSGLWTYRPDSFLPHGTAADGHPEWQPVWLTVREENPNGASVLVLLDDAEAYGLDAFARCLYLFDRGSPEGREAARERWRRYRDAGHALRFWELGPGGWVSRM